MARKIVEWIERALDDAALRRILQEHFVTRVGDYDDYLCRVNREGFRERFERAVTAVTGSNSRHVSAIERIMNERLGVSRVAYEKLPYTNVDMDAEADLVFAAWCTEGGDLTCVERGNYDRIGDSVDACQFQVVRGRRVPYLAGFVCQWKNQPLFVHFELRFNPYKWQIGIHGEITDDFTKEFQARIENYLVRRYRGTAVQADLSPLELPVWHREDLVLPLALARKIDNLIVVFRNWFASDAVSRWGYLLIGEPGVGKTTVGAMLAGMRPKECTYLYCPAGKLTTTAMIDEVFRLARQLAPVVLQVDDVDLIARTREESERATLTSSLMENLDGLATGTSKIFVILTTNDPSRMERAIVDRAGRVCNKIVFAGFGECLPELIVRYGVRFGLDLDRNMVEHAVREFGDQAAAFTPDEAKNVCQRLHLLHGATPVTATMLVDTLRETHETFHGEEREDSR